MATAKIAPAPTNTRVDMDQLRQWVPEVVDVVVM
jgi:hypothetical protein